MKKILTIGIALTLGLSLVGCKKNNEVENDLVNENNPVIKFVTYLANMVSQGRYKGVQDKVRPFCRSVADGMGCMLLASGHGKKEKDGCYVKK